MGSSRQASSPPSELAVKRRKLQSACEACQRRKSRCELVTATGCHRCHTLKTVCSLAGKVQYKSGEDHSGLRDGARDLSSRRGSASHGGPNLDEADAGSVQDIQRRLKRVESLLEKVTGRTSLPGDSEGRSLGSGVPVEENLAESAAAQANRALGVFRPSSARDPVTSGLISPDQWSSIYTSFRHDIDFLIPLKSLLPTIPPVCPLLRTCIIFHHVDKIDPYRSTPLHAHLFTYLQVNLDRTSALPYTREAVLALLILSLVPSLLQGSDRYTPPDSFNAASRALDMAYYLGLDMAVERVMREPSEDEEREWLEQDVADMNLFHSVVNRSRWINIFNSPSLLIQPLRFHPMQTRHLRELSDPLRVHLFMEHGLLHLIDGVLKPFRALRTARMYEQRLSEEVVRGMSDYAYHVSLWRRSALDQTAQCISARILILTSHLFDILLHLQISSVTNIPTPLGFDAASGLFLKYANGILVSASSALSYLIQQPDIHLGHLPAFTFTLVVLAYTTISQARKMSEHRQSTQTTPNSSGSPLTIPRLDPIDRSSPNLLIPPHQVADIRMRIVTAHPQHKLLLDRIDNADSPVKWGEAIEDLRQSQSFGDGDGGLWTGFNWGALEGMDFDFNSFFGIQAGFGAE